MDATFGVARLEAAAGCRFGRIASARGETEHRLDARRERLTALDIDAEGTIVLMGSWGRREVTSESDDDFMVLFEGAERDDATDPWGVKVTVVEIKDVGIPSSMQRAMARQAEAERERRAKVIHAEGEFQASERLRAAAEIISQHPAALQLRYLQTLGDVGANQNSTIIFPLPIDMIRPFLERADVSAGTAEAPQAQASPRDQPGIEAHDRSDALPLGATPSRNTDPADEVPQDSSTAV